MAENIPAFPLVQTREEYGNNGWHSAVSSHGGMSLRDYFAAAALPSVLAHYLVANGNGCAADHALRNVPALAYKYADAMLAERAKGGQ